MAMILEDEYKRVQVIQEGVGRTCYFKMVKNIRFVDIDNLDKYSITQLKSIYNGGFGVRGARKHEYIRWILNDEKLMSELISGNREYKLNQLGI